MGTFDRFTHFIDSNVSFVVPPLPFHRNYVIRLNILQSECRRTKHDDAFARSVEFNLPLNHCCVCVSATSVNETMKNHIHHIGRVLHKRKTFDVFSFCINIRRTFSCCDEGEMCYVHSN